MAAAAIPVAIVEEPMLSRLDRLDTIVKQLEEIRGGRLSLINISSSPAKSSFESTNSRGTLTSSDGGHDPPSSVDFSPRSLEKHCRPIDDVMMETELKGNVLERLAHVEDRVMKICVDLEKELVVGIDHHQIKESREEILPEIRSPTTPTSTTEKKGSKKKGLKQLVKSCVKGKHKSRQEQLLN